MLLELRDVKKYFPIKGGLIPRAKDYVRAVDGVSLSMAEGEHLGLVGESGCGKTTLARLILKLYETTGGTITFDGREITSFSQKEFRPLRTGVQIVFQDPYSSLDPRYSVRRILKEALTLTGGGEKNGGTERMTEMLKAVGLPGDTLSRYPHEFSGGERQRIAIARALMMRPKLLILDEAVSSLDVLIQQQILELLERLREEYRLTYLFISHDLRVVRKLCSRIAVMYKGRLIEVAPQKELFNNPLHAYTRELLEAAIHYRSRKGARPELDEKSRLIDKGDGHYVLD